MSDSRFSLSWDTYQKNICNGLGLLQQKGEFVDMTITADGHQVKVHQMVMSLVSPYIKELITSAQCPHPIVFLNRVSYETLQAILEYAYTGEVLVSRDILHEFLETCNALHIKGLENKGIATLGEGLLSLLNDEETQELLNGPVQEESCTEQPITEQPTQTLIDNNITDEEIDENDDYTMEESHLDESALDDDVAHYETIGLDDRADNSVDIKRRKPSLRSTKANLYNEKGSSLSAENYINGGSKIQYTLSNQGGIQIALNRFLYRLRHTRKSSERLWRCSDYSKKSCQAYAITRGDTIIERGCAHNHPFHDNQILKRLRNGNMYSAFTAIENVALSKKQTYTIKSKDKEQGSYVNKLIYE